MNYIERGGADRVIFYPTQNRYISIVFDYGIILKYIILEKATLTILVLGGSHGYHEEKNSCFVN